MYFSTQPYFHTPYTEPTLRRYCCRTKLLKVLFSPSGPPLILSPSQSPSVAVARGLGSAGCAGKEWVPPGRPRSPSLPVPSPPRGGGCSTHARPFPASQRVSEMSCWALAEGHENRLRGTGTFITTITPTRLWEHLGTQPVGQASPKEPPPKLSFPQPPAFPQRGRGCSPCSAPGSSRA